MNVTEVKIIGMQVYLKLHCRRNPKGEDVFNGG